MKNIFLLLLFVTLSASAQETKVLSMELPSAKAVSISFADLTIKIERVK